MVRVKAKKAKGDDAFVKRKQKVGRKKLAPVTATQADVHARTLRISTSSSLAVAAGISATGKSVIPTSTATGSPDAITPGSKRQRDHADKAVDIALTTITAHSFAELLAGTQHYKASQRASAFASMAKLLSLQADKEAAAAREGAGSRHADYVVLPTSSPTAATAPSSPSVLDGVNPLEKIKCFAAALEAMTDTDDQVRRAALHGLRTLLGQVDFFAVLRHNDDEAMEVGRSGIDPADDHTEAYEDDRASQTQLDHVVAVLQAIHVGLTHALKPVRLSAIELLGLLLNTAPASAIRAAARAVCRQQQAYLNTSGSTPLIGVLGMGTAGAMASTTTPATASVPTAASGDKDMVRAEEEWMLTLVRRVSALVLRTEYMPVLAELLTTFLFPQQLLSQMASPSAMPIVIRDASVVRRDAGWQHPDLVKNLFDELLPKWSNAWKELMELKLQLLRQDSKLIIAAALAQCFATVLVFLKAQQALDVRGRNEEMRGNATGNRTPAPALFSRQLVQYVRELLIQRIPVTLAEVLRQESSAVVHEADGASGEPPARDGKKRATVSSSTLTSTLLPERIGENATNCSGYHSRGLKTDPRLQLALSLARISVPLAGTDDGWRLLHQFFSVVFSYQSHRTTTAPSASSSSTTTASRTLDKGPYHFHTQRDLLSCVQTFHLALQLYPSTTSVATDSAAEEVSLTPQAHQQRMVLRKLIPFVPAVLQTVTRELGRAARPVYTNPHTTRAAQHLVAVEDAIVLRQLTLIADMMRVVTTFPLPCPTLQPEAGTPSALRLSQSSHEAHVDNTLTQGKDVRVQSASSAPSAAHAKADEVLRSSVEQACLLLPRLLFGLRWQRKETTVTSAVAAEAASAHAQDAVLVRTRVQRVGVLAQSTGALDRVVRRLLLCVWSVASSGHPLLLAPTHSTSASSFVSQWRGALMSLYGLVKPDQSGDDVVVVAEGVLARCTASTAAVARDALIYLGVRDSEKLTVHSLNWRGGGEDEWSTVANDRVASSASRYSIEDMLAMLPA